MIPSLPYELNRDIILLNLPAVLFRNRSKERYTALKCYSLVSPIWREISQAELMKHLYVPNLESLRGLIEEFERRKAASLITRVMSLRIDSGVDKFDLALSSNTRRLFLFCKRMEEVWIDQVDSVGLLDCFGSASYPNLRSLHLQGYYCFHKSPKSRVNCHFPALTHLTISRVDSKGLDFLSDILLKLSITPSLNSLAFIHCSSNNSPINSIPSSIARQIKRLTLIHLPLKRSSVNFKKESVQVSSMEMKSLETLVIRCVPQLLSFTNISSNLSTIHIYEISKKSYEKDLFDLKKWIGSIDTQHQIRKIIYSSPSVEKTTCSSTFVDDTKAFFGELRYKFIPELEARGIKFFIRNVIECPAVDFLDTVLNRQ